MLGSRTLLTLDRRPDALFVANNLMTIGAVDALDERGMTFPDDIALVTFDDMSWTLGLRSSLASITQPTYDIGRVATELLLRRVRREDFPPKHVVLTATLNVRASSRVSPAGEPDPGEAG